jgi:hypothetical protein
MPPLHLELIMLCSQTSCSLQTGTQPHCSELMVWTLEHKDQWRKTSTDLFLCKTKSPWWCTTTNWTSNVSNVTFLCVIFDRRMTWRHHIERTVTKALHMYVRAYSLFKSGCASTSINLHFAKLWLGKLWLMPAPPGVCSRCWPLEFAAPAEQSTPHYWKSWQVHTSLRIAHGFQNSLCVWLHN